MSSINELLNQASQKANPPPPVSKPMESVKTTTSSFPHSAPISSNHQQVNNLPSPHSTDKKRGKSALLIGGLLTIVALIVGIILFLVITKKKGAKKEDERKVPVPPAQGNGPGNQYSNGAKPPPSIQIPPVPPTGMYPHQDPHLMNYYQQPPVGHHPPPPMKAMNAAPVHGHGYHPYVQMPPQNHTVPPNSHNSRSNRKVQYTEPEQDEEAEEESTTSTPKSK